MRIIRIGKAAFEGSPLSLERSSRGCYPLMGTVETLRTLRVIPDRAEHRIDGTNQTPPPAASPSETTTGAAR